MHNTILITKFGLNSIGSLYVFDMEFQQFVALLIIAF